MIKYVWLSHPLSPKTPAYGGGPSFEVEPIKSIINGDSCNTAVWHVPNHVGTHVDVPKHFYDTVETIDAFKPEFWVFEHVCLIEIELDNPGVIIGPEVIIPLIGIQPDLLLIKTGMGIYRYNSKYWKDNPGLSPTLARELRVRYPHLRAVGMDFISVSSWRNRDIGREAHCEFLNPVGPGNFIVLIEDMNLQNINRDMFIKKVTALPLRVENGDGAPCTVFAEVNE